jgi:ribosome biogenesis GTPase
VGDWVAIDPRHDGASIHAIMRRRTAIVRHAPGLKTVAQVVGANVDTVFVVASLNADLNLRRLERYLAVAWESGAEPVVVLSKADLVDDPATMLAEVEAVAGGAVVLTVSAWDGRGLDAVGERIGPGRTVAFVGSSGVGKSTLLNALAGEERALVREIREDDARGRHTTTRRELHVLAGGGLILDTPGMRELAPWDAADGIDRSFADIEALAATCRFSDCAHAREPGCAVQAALHDGALPPRRLESWRKLHREVAVESARQAVRLTTAGRRRRKG